MPGFSATVRCANEERRASFEVLFIEGILRIDLKIGRVDCETRCDGGMFNVYSSDV